MIGLSVIMPAPPFNKWDALGSIVVTPDGVRRRVVEVAPQRDELLLENLELPPHMYTEVSWYSASCVTSCAELWSPE